MQINQNTATSFSKKGKRAPTKQIAMCCLTLFAVSMATGCSSSKKWGPPSAITFEDAMGSVGTGLSKLKANEGDLNTGLIPSEVTVTFNVAASQTNSKGLMIELSPPAGAPVDGKLGANMSSTTANSRANQITIKFSNIMLAPTNTLVGAMGTNTVHLLKLLHQNGSVFAQELRQVNPKVFSQ